MVLSVCVSQSLGQTLRGAGSPLGVVGRGAVRGTQARGVGDCWV